MKLIYCITCEDVVKLQPHRRYCQCASTWGRYLDDRTNHIEVHGPAKILGIDDRELRSDVLPTLHLIPVTARTVHWHD